MDPYSERRHRSHQRSRKDGRHHCSSRHQNIDIDDFHPSSHRRHRDVDRKTSHSLPKPGTWIPNTNAKNETTQSSGNIESWLMDVGYEGVTSPTVAGARYGYQDWNPNLSQRPAWRPHGLEIQDEFPRGHKRYRSRDSSIIESGKRHTGPRATVPSRCRDTQIHQQRVLDQIVPNDSISLASITSPRFEKRARHKTREDRYESKKQPRHKERKSRREKLEQPSLPQKKSLSSGKYVMENFHSGAILKDRLTLQPTITPGLFQNGRVSSPKHVEELAYNSLAALEHPPARLPSRQQHNRSRTREQQRLEREARDIRDFFGRKDAPRNEGKHATSRPHLSQSNRTLSAQIEPDDRYRQYGNGLEYAGKPAENTQEKAMDYLRSREQNGTMPTLRRRASSRATTYLTWSTSDDFQSSVAHRMVERQTSRTPELIRTQLRQTGVFDGIEIRGSDREPEFEALSARESHHPVQGSASRETHVNQDERLRQATPGPNPMVVRYQDKGVMTAGELPLGTQQQSNVSEIVSAHAHTGDQESSGSKSVSQLEPIEQNVRPDNNVPSGQEIQTPTTRVQVASQAYLGPSSKEISTQTTPKSTSHEQGHTEQGRSRVVEEVANNVDSEPIILAPSTAMEPRGEATSVIEPQRGTSVKILNSSGDQPASARSLVASLKTSTTAFSPYLRGVSATSSLTSQHSNFLDGIQWSKLSHRPVCEPDSTANGFPFAGPEIALQDSLYHWPIGHAYEQYLGSSRVENDESLLDFIARAEKDVLGDGEFDTHSYNDMESNQLLHEEVGYFGALCESWDREQPYGMDFDSLQQTLPYPKNASQSHAQRGQLSAIHHHSQPPYASQTGPVPLTENKAREGVEELWPPNLF